MWKFPTDLATVFVIRTKTKEGIRKLKVFVAAMDGQLWCLYYPPSFSSSSSSPSSYSYDLLSSQIPDADSKYSNNYYCYYIFNNDVCRKRQLGKGEAINNKKQKLDSSSQLKGETLKKNNVDKKISVINILQTASRNRVTIKVIIFILFLLFSIFSFLFSFPFFFFCLLFNHF